MSKKASSWIPEIMYEEDPNGTSHALPFVLVPDQEEMPKLLFIWEHRDTGEKEPGPDGEDVPIVEAELRQYARMDLLKDKLAAEDYDKVRTALGLDPMKAAVQKGRDLTNRVRDAVTKNNSDAN